ncbi:unnamed protein product, partial [Symbiodinium sp. KB8]
SLSVRSAGASGAAGGGRDVPHGAHGGCEPFLPPWTSCYGDAAGFAVVTPHPKLQRLRLRRQSLHCR